tara:strand:+ start:120 stop:233 length:114 start_codon:yes stop_codon:yes gene_type:complete
MTVIIPTNIKYKYILNKTYYWKPEIVGSTPSMPTKLK